MQILTQVKKLAGKNTALRKFHVSVHLRTPVDRAGIVSKKICGNFDFTPLLKSYDNLKKFASYHTSKNTSFEHNIYAKYLLLASGMESRLQLLSSSVKNSVP